MAKMGHFMDRNMQKREAQVPVCMAGFRNEAASFRRERFAHFDRLGWLENSGELVVDGNPIPIKLIIGRRVGSL